MRAAYLGRATKTFHDLWRRIEPLSSVIGKFPIVIFSAWRDHHGRTGRAAEIPRLVCPSRVRGTFQTLLSTATF